MDERRRAMEAVWGDAEARAAGVRWLMAECRARLAAEDAAWEAGVAAATDVPRESPEAPAPPPLHGRAAHASPVPAVSPPWHGARQEAAR